MKRQVLKAKAGCSFWSYAKYCKGLKKINDSVKSSLQRWIIPHPHVIKSPMKNYYITVKFNYGIKGEKTKIRQKEILQVSVR